MPADKPVRIAVDIGGTFTDLQIQDARTGAINAFKTPSTPQDPSIGLIDGIQGAASKFGFALADIGLIMHGSTIATNAVLERKLSKGALITTAGFEDVLEIGRHIRKNVYALKAEPRALLIPRQLRFGIRERMRANGNVEQPLDQAAIADLAPRLVDQGIEAVAITFLHAYRNPAHELEAAEKLATAVPSLSITTSFESSPEIREYERTSTTVLNALLKPVISGYLQRLQERLATAGIAPLLYIVQSNGGVATPDEAARMPVNLLLSGPAGGAMAIERLAGAHGISNLVGLDMGGTSSDVSVVMDGVIGVTAESEIDGLPVRLPMIEIRTIGAGGGSLARVETGALRVGPQSAGAVPGPACYGRGGEQPTVTDANASLGLLSPTTELAGGMKLDVDMARQAGTEHIAKPLGLGVEVAAAGIAAVANTHMAGAIRLSLFAVGADPADFALAPFGGAAGLHACAVADELEIQTIVFPADASTLSARGILLADLRRDLSRSELMMAVPDNLPRLSELVAALNTEARERLTETGLPPGRHQIRLAADMRYRGQAYEITTPWQGLDPTKAIDEASLARLVAAFHALHATRYAHSAEEDAVELVTIRASAIGLLEPVREQPPINPVPEAAVQSGRRVFQRGAWSEIPVHSRQAVLALATDERLSGPIIIDEEYTVLFIAEGWEVGSHGGGDLVATRLENRK